MYAFLKQLILTNIYLLYDIVLFIFYRGPLWKEDDFILGSYTTN